MWVAGGVWSVVVGFGLRREGGAGGLGDGELLFVAARESRCRFGGGEGVAECAPPVLASVEREPG